jgi:hypothetical protein
MSKTYFLPRTFRTPVINVENTKNYKKQHILFLINTNFFGSTKWRKE